MPEQVSVFVDKVSKKYDKYVALKSISFQIMDGEIFGLLGPNGAGKSTLLKIMTGLLDPDSGRVAFFGAELKSNYNELKNIFSIVPQDPSFYHTFSAEQNIRLFGEMYGLHGTELWERTNSLMDWLDLKKFKDKRASQLSGGYQKLLNIACSLINDPKIIFMDEPTAGLDPKMRQLFWEKLAELKKLGKTICLTTHYMEEAQSICDRAGIIHQGKVLQINTPKNLIGKFGGIKVLIFTLDREIDEEILETIKGTFKKMEPTAVKNKLIVPLMKKGSLQELTMIFDFLRSNKYNVVFWEVREPNLEDVFLNLTGTELRD